jgi:hypothetical protein
MEILGQDKHYSTDNHDMDNFKAGYNQGRSDMLGEQRSALRTVLG